MGRGRDLEQAVEELGDVVLGTVGEIRHVQPTFRTGLVAPLPGRRLPPRVSPHPGHRREDWTLSGPKDDVATVLARRHENGGDFWATADGRIYVGNPYSTIGALGVLHELGVGADHEAVQGATALLLGAVRDDGRIRVGPSSPMYPCYTAEAARMLCRFGFATHPAVGRTVDYLVEHTHESGGWRCSFSRFGKGPETQCGSPGATLYALDVLRFFPDRTLGQEWVDRAVDLLLAHWDSRRRIGPCHHGIGRRFLRVEYPFIRYNVFYWVFVLSFFPRGQTDDRLKEAFSQLAGRLDGEGRLVPEESHRGLKDLHFCRKGEPSSQATERFREIERRMGG